MYEQSAMVNNRLLLGSVAFGVSLSLSLLMRRDLKTSLLTGLVTVPATFSGVAVASYKQRTQQKIILTALQSQIYQLEKWETQLNQSLLAIATEQQRTEVNLNFLKLELNQLYNTIAAQRSSKQQLSQEVITLQEHKTALEVDLHDLQAQIYNCEQRRGELHQYLRSIRAEKQNTELALNSAQTELKHLYVQIAEQENQKQKVEQDLVAIQQLKPQIEENLHSLHIQTQEIERQKTEINHSLSTLKQDKHLTEIELNLLQSKLQQIQAQIIDEQTSKKLTHTVARRPQETEKQIELADEWAKLGAQLTNFQLQVVKVIIQQSEPSSAIRKIAEENVTMPEILLDSINERALDTIGDLIIEPGNGYSVPPKISEEYLTNVNKLIKNNEMN